MATSANRARALSTVMVATTLVVVAPNLASPTSALALALVLHLPRPA